MKIVFNMRECGLGNNGGTRTIILCSKTLESLGHKSNVLANVDNFTWFKHKPIITSIPKNVDIAVATACTTVDSTLHLPARKKVWYIRAHEKWTMSEPDLVKRYKSGIINIVNSKGLEKLLSSFGVKSKVVYQGIDLHWWRDKKTRKPGKIRIGSLHTAQKSKRWRDFVALAKRLGTEKYEYVGIGNKKSKADFLTDFKANANVDQLNDLYSSCHIWFAPTDSEGLHNVPMEAALCGCLVVCSDHTLNGMVHDYAFDDTAMIYKFGDLNHAAAQIKNADFSKIGKMKEHITKNIGSREQNMLKFVDALKI